jgi:hypothetical protein
MNLTNLTNLTRLSVMSLQKLSTVNFSILLQNFQVQLEPHGRMCVVVPIFFGVPIRF